MKSFKRIFFIFNILFLFNSFKIYEESLPKEYKFDLRMNEYSKLEINEFSDSIYSKITPSNPSKNQDIAKKLCFSRQRHLKFSSKRYENMFDLLNSFIFPKFLDYIYIDFNILLVDENLSVFQFKIDLFLESVDFIQKILSPKKIVVSESKIIYNSFSNKINIISNNYSYSLSYFDEKVHSDTRENTDFKESAVNSVVSYSNNLILIASGANGLDIYEQPKEIPVLIHRKNLKKEDLQIDKEIEINDIVIDHKNNWIYLLCGKTGIHLYEFNPKGLIFNKKKNFYMNYQGGRFINILNNSAVVLTGKVLFNGIYLSYFFEILFDYYPENNDIVHYTLNRYVYENHDMGKSFCSNEICIIPWGQQNLMYFYGINSEILKNEQIAQIHLFNEPNIVGGTIVKIHQNLYKLILARNKGISVRNIEIEYAGMDCYLKEAGLTNEEKKGDILGKYSFDIILYSKNCEKKNRLKDNSLVNICSKKGKIFIDLYKGFTTKQKTFIFLGTLFGIIVMLVLFGFAFYFCFRKYRERISDLQTKLRSTSKSAKYEDFTSEEIEMEKSKV